MKFLLYFLRSKHLIHAELDDEVKRNFLKMFSVLSSFNVIFTDNQHNLKSKDTTLQKGTLERKPTCLFK